MEENICNVSEAEADEEEFAGCTADLQDLTTNITFWWPPTLPLCNISQPCPKIVPNQAPGLLATRHCLLNGTWERANFSTCIDSILPPDCAGFECIKDIARIIQFSGSILSLTLLCISFYIFVAFRSIQCSRLSVHKNLVFAFILYYIVQIALLGPHINQRHDFYNQHMQAYNVLISLHLLTKMSHTSWLFNEGFYLHSRITTSIFDSDAPFLFFHSVGWGLSGFCVFIWTVVMYCNVGWNERWTLQNNYIWIILGPMATLLIVNMLFLINIVKILVTKLRANSTPEAAQLRKAMKAVGVLFGFLGFSNFIFFYNHQDQGFWEAAYLITNSISQSSQGIVVSVLYCFCSPDVRMAIAKRMYRIKVRWHSRNLRRDNNRRFRESRRGLTENTCSTKYLPNTGEDIKTRKNSVSSSHRLPRWPYYISKSPEIHHLHEINNGSSITTATSVQNQIEPQRNKSNGHTLKVWIHSPPSALVPKKFESTQNASADEIQESCL